MQVFHGTRMNFYDEPIRGFDYYLLFINLELNQYFWKGQKFDHKHEGQVRCYFGFNFTKIMPMQRFMNFPKIDLW